MLHTYMLKLQKQKFSQNQIGSMSAFRSLIPNPSKHDPVFDCLATVQCAKMEKILSRGDVMLG